MNKIIQKHIPKLGRQEGLSLVEVLLTLGLMTLVLVGFMQLFIYCAALSSLSGNVTMAMSEAENKLEEIRNHTFENILQDYTDTCPCADAQDNDLDGLVDYDGYNDGVTVYAPDPECTAFNTTFGSDPAESVSSTSTTASCSGTFTSSLQLMHISIPIVKIPYNCNTFRIGSPYGKISPDSTLKVHNMRT